VVCCLSGYRSPIEGQGPEIALATGGEVQESVAKGDYSGLFWPVHWKACKRIGLRRVSQPSW
jgi:hypothetical protein